MKSQDQHQLSTNEIGKLATLLDDATLMVSEIERLTLTHPRLSLTEAYVIQDSGIQKRLSRGEKHVGFKMGLTSEAKRKQMSLDSSIYGVLTDQMELKDGSTFSLQRSIHPKIEPEIAFIIGREIRGPISFSEALESCSGVCAALEILDSRFLNFKYFSLPDVVADNCSSSYFVLSNTIKKPTEINLANLEMIMSVNGVPVERASSSAISGHPLNSLIELCAMLSDRNLALPAGSIVLAGAATLAVPLEAGAQVRLNVEELGSVTLSIG